MWPLDLWLLALSASAQQLIGIVAAALIAAGATYLVARRTGSGRVTTSTADSLWTAYDRLNQRIENDNASLREENGKLRERVAVLEREVDRLLPLEREVDRLRGIVNGD